MCDSAIDKHNGHGVKTIPVQDAVGAVLAHDVTEIRKDEFKGPAFRKGHIIRKEDVCHLQRIGKERLFVLSVGPDEMHEDEAAFELARALIGEGVMIKGEPREGKITLVAARDGLLKINVDALRAFNMLGDVMCATLHTNTVVKKGQEVAGTRAIPLVIKRSIIEEAVRIAKKVQSSEFNVQSTGVVEVKELRKPKAGVVITGNEVYHGKIKDAFAPVITKKIEEIGGELAGVYYAPDDKAFIVDRLRELMNAGADLLITTGGMSVDPDDVTRFAIKELGAIDITYGSAVLPGAMFLIAYLNKGQGSGVRGQGTSEILNSEPRTGSTHAHHHERQSNDPYSELIPILGIPACGMYAKTTIFDLVLPRVLAGERIGRKEVAALGHGGLCMKCDVCRYPVCPFGKLG